MFQQCPVQESLNGNVLVEFWFWKFGWMAIDKKVN